MHRIELFGSEDSLDSMEIPWIPPPLNTSVVGNFHLLYFGAVPYLKGDTGKVWGCAMSSP